MCERGGGSKKERYGECNKQMKNESRTTVGQGGLGVGIYPPPSPPCHLQTLQRQVCVKGGLYNVCVGEERCTRAIPGIGWMVNGLSAVGGVFAS